MRLPHLRGRSICARSPVPLSPMTRNFTESLPTGGWTSVAADIARRSQAADR
jgi:hypothetical protein